MSTLTCRCGHFIRTGDERMNYAATLLPEYRKEALFDLLSAQIDSWTAAREQGHSKSQWAEVASDNPEIVEAFFRYKLLEETMLEASREVFQCQQCGRIHVETSHPNSFRSFTPDSDDAYNLFDA